MPGNGATSISPPRQGSTASATGGRIERAAGQPLSNSTVRQRRVALLACLLMLACSALLLPYASMPIGFIPAFFPVYQTVAIGSCLITAYLLYARFQAVGAVPLLNLGAGYVYTALVLAMQMLSFQGMFPEGTQAFGGPQTTVWLWLFWHLGPASSVIFLALTESRREVNARSRNAAQVRTALALATATGATAVLVFGFQAALPVLDVAGNYRAVNSTGLAAALQILLAVTLAVLWKASRFRNALHVWLAITVVALFCDNALTMAGGERSSLGWYCGRLVALLGFSVLTVVYLWEIRTSYAQSVQHAHQLAFSNLRLDARAQESDRHVEDLLRADLRKDEFLVMLAHELRNPLAPMQAAAQLLSIAHADEQLVLRTSEMLTRQVKQMSGLVEDLLDASRLSRGLAELDEVPLDVQQVLAESIEQARPLLEDKGHTLTVQLPDQELRVAGDHRRLVQVFTNLLVNSAKYTPRGGKVDVDLHAAEEEVLVRFKDNGIGMSPDLLGRAFMLFAQGAPSPHKPHGGLGIGLALVKSLVELHHGTVQASSAGEGLGTDMVVRLPKLHEVQREPARPANPGPFKSGRRLMPQALVIAPLHTLAGPRRAAARSGYAGAFSSSGVQRRVHD